MKAFLKIFQLGILVVCFTFIALADNSERIRSSEFYSAFLANEFITLKPHGITEINENAEFETSISPWAFPVYTLDIIDSYIPFIFRTQKSAEIEELKVIISVNNKGKISNYEVLNEDADKGLKERVGHVIRKMPNAQPIPGFASYDPMEFELVIKK